ncbi:MAG: PQQ-dependent sugar dehydrogenase [Pseudomonadota bacterium]
MKPSLRAILFCLSFAIPQVALTNEYTLETIAEGFAYPWCLEFLPDGRYLLSMRDGELRIVGDDGAIGEPIANVPDTYVASQGGFFDVVLDPAYAQNQTLYLAFAYGDVKNNATRITKAQLKDNALHNVETIFTVSPMKSGPAHYGGKLLFLADGTLLLTTGDGFDFREAAQDTFSQLGKIVRMNTDGSAPEDNPFADGKQGDPMVWSFGHRSPQGLAWNPDTGIVYMHEHGPMGGDEVNIVKPGSNYGWPAITYGSNYSGAYVSPFTEAPGMLQPIKQWTPSIAPSGLVYYRGDKFPAWQGSLFVGALVDEEVRRLSLNGEAVTSEEALFSELGARIRDIREGPNGYLYILTDSDAGKLLRVLPK